MDQQPDTRRSDSERPLYGRLLEFRPSHGLAGNCPTSGSRESERWSLQKQKGLDPRTEAFEINPGGDLRSHTVTRAVSSALRGLTSVFGMGTGVTPAVWPPGKL